MKTLRLVSILFISAILFTGCDFVRSLLGKPTSEDLERMRIESEAKAKKQREADSLEQVKAADLAREMEAQAAKEAEALNESDGRFRVILGSFKVENNATNMFARLERMGCKPERIMFKNGFDVVSAGSYETYNQAYDAMVGLLVKYEWTPEDIWIYDINQNLHK